MATNGNLNRLRKTSIPELLGICVFPRGLVEELDSVTEGDANAGTILIPRQFNGHEKHGDRGYNDSDDDESGEEEHEYND